MARSKTIEVDEVRQGETLEYQYGFKDNTDLSVNWTCRVVVQDDTNPIDKAVTLLNGTNTRFIVALDEAETSLLSLGVHKMGIEIENTVLNPDVRKEHVIELTVLERVVPQV